MYSPEALYKLTDLPLQEEDFENDENAVEPTGTQPDVKSEIGGQDRPNSAKSYMSRTTMFSPKRTGREAKNLMMPKKMPEAAPTSVPNRPNTIYSPTSNRRALPLLIKPIETENKDSNIDEIIAQHFDNTMLFRA